MTGTTDPIDDVSFTFEWYESLLNVLQSDDRQFRTFEDDAEKGTVLYRHDVDWSPRKAVELGRIEADHDVTATYFFLVTSPFYNPQTEAVRSAIERLVDLGHKIGLHFSTHQYEVDESTPLEEVAERVDRERRILGETAGTSVDVVSFHNPPDWILREAFEDFVSTYEPRFFDTVEYRADSNQRWRETHPFADGIPDPLQVLTHPVLWGERDAWAVDRLREERDYHAVGIDEHLARTDRTWESPLGIGGRDDEGPLY